MSADKETLPKVSLGQPPRATALRLTASSLGCEKCGVDETVLIDPGAGGAPLCVKCLAASITDEERRTAKDWHEIASAAVAWIATERRLGPTAPAAATRLARLRARAERYLDASEARSLASHAKKGTNR